MNISYTIVLIWLFRNEIFDNVESLMRLQFTYKHVLSWDKHICMHLEQIYLIAAWQILMVLNNLDLGHLN